MPFYAVAVEDPLDGRWAVQGEAPDVPATWTQVTHDQAAVQPAHAAEVLVPLRPQLRLPWTAEFGTNHGVAEGAASAGA